MSNKGLNNYCFNFQSINQIEKPTSSLCLSLKLSLGLCLLSLKFRLDRGICLEFWERSCDFPPLLGSLCLRGRPKSIKQTLSSLNQ